MVSSAASKVTHRHEDEAEIDQFDDEYYDEVEAEGHTIAMSPIDVEQFNEEETFSASEEGISSQVSLQETTVSPHSSMKMRSMQKRMSIPPKPRSITKQHLFLRSWAWKVWVQQARQLLRRAMMLRSLIVM